MKDVADILAAIRSKGVELWVEEGKVCYRSPRGALTVSEVDTLRAHRSRLVDLLTGCVAPQPSGPLLAPVTSQQEWVWNMVQQYKNWNVLLYAFAVRVVGDLSCSTLQKAFGEIVRRHGALRTRMVASAGALNQQVQPESEPWHIGIVPVEDSAGIGKEAAARRSIEDYFDRITHPDAAALFEVKLLRMSPSEHVVAIAIHHIISDAYSLSILFRELWVLYRDYSRGQASSLPSVSGQYADYASWQRLEESNWHDCHDGYWNERLAAAPRLRLPIEVQAEGVKPGGRTPSELKVCFGDAVCAGVRELARREHTLPSLVVFSAYVTVVARWCGLRDLILPFDITGRHLPEHENMLGFFSYYLYVRLRLDGNDTFAQLLRKVGHDVYEAIDHQDFTRASQKATGTPSNTSFNWVAVSPAEISGVPPKEMGLDIDVTPFPFQRRSRNPEEEGGNDVTDGYAAVVFYDTGGCFEATVYHLDGHASAVGEFMQELERSLREFLHNRNAPVGLY